MSVASSCWPARYRRPGERSREVMGQLRQTVDSGMDSGEHVVWALAAKHAEPGAAADGGGMSAF